MRARSCKGGQAVGRRAPPRLPDDGHRQPVSDWRPPRPPSPAGRTPDRHFRAAPSAPTMRPSASIRMTLAGVIELAVRQRPVAAYRARRPACGQLAASVRASVQCAPSRCRSSALLPEHRDAVVRRVEADHQHRQAGRVPRRSSVDPDVAHRRRSASGTRTRTRCRTCSPASAGRAARRAGPCARPGSCSGIAN